MKNFLVDFFTVHEVQILVITKAVAAWRRRTALGSFRLSRPDLEFTSLSIMSSLLSRILNTN